MADATLKGADAHDATGFANAAATFKAQGYSFVAQYIDQFPDANTGGSPSVTSAQIHQETSAGLNIVSIFQTNGMSSSAGDSYQTYFTAEQGAADAQEALTSAMDLGQPAGSAIYFAMDFDPAAYGAAGSEASLLFNVRSYLGAVSTVLNPAGYAVGVYGAGDTLAAAIRTNPAVAQVGWLTQSYGWAGSNPQTDANAQGWKIYQGFETTQNGVAIDPDTASSTGSMGAWTVCYCAGTLIRTVRGDIAVEELAVGDLVVTASGEHRPIRWLGHNEVDCRNHPRPREAMPVRIAAHAFGPQRPERDLWLSPAHALCLDVLGEVFVPASALINGSTVAQVNVETVTYWHVELDSHDVLIANGQPAESYMDVGNRAFFATGKGRIDPDREVAAGPSASCRPFHPDGALVETVRMQIKARALALGWTIGDAPLAGMHLLVDGVRVEPDADGLSARFVLPSAARDVWLVSNTGVPAYIGNAAGSDDRKLGLCLGSLTVDDGIGIRREIAASDPRLREGFHEAAADHRWTDGFARLPASLWEGCRGSFFLRVDLQSPAVPCWVGPTEPEPAAAAVLKRELRLVYTA